MNEMLQRSLWVALVLLIHPGCTRKAKIARALDKADSSFASGSFEDALIRYRSILRSDPKNVRALTGAGTIWLERGAVLQAIPLLSRAVELQPTDVALRTKLATAFIGMGRGAEARKEALRILELDPNHEDGLRIAVDTAETAAQQVEARNFVETAKDKGSSGVLLARSMLALRNGNLADADAMVEKALADNPKSMFPHLAQARIARLRNDSEKAENAHKAAADLAPTRSAARLAYVQCLIQNNKTAKASAYLKDLTEREKDFLPAWIYRARLSSESKDYPASLAFLEKVLAIDPSNLEARLLEGQVLLLSGQVEKAVDRLTKLGNSYSKFPPVKYELARAHVANRAPDLALAALAAALQISPDYTEAAILSAELRLQLGNNKEVVQAMTDLLAKRASLTPAALLLAQAHQNAGETEKAVRALGSIIQLVPDAAEPHFLLGTILTQQKKLEEAQRSLENAQRLAPDNLQVAQQLVEIDLRRGDTAHAVERGNRLLETQSSAAGAHFIAARAYYENKEHERAESALKRCLALDPNFTQAYDTLASIYLAKDDLAQARVQVSAKAAIEPRNPSAWLMVSSLSEKALDFDKAREAYLKVIELEPNSAVALNNLASLYANHFGQPEKAYELARRARTLRPDDPAIADTFGWILYGRKEYQQALSTLQEAAQKMPQDPEVQFHFGMANYMMGNIEAARGALAKAVESEIQFAGKETGRKRLAALGGNSGQTLPSGLEWQKQAELAGDDPIGWLRSGEAYEKEQAWKQAKEAYEKATAANPRLATPVARLAQLYAGPLQDLPRAIELGKKARELAPADPEIEAALGIVAFRFGDTAWSYNLLQESARKAQNVEALYFLGWAAYGQGKLDEARETMKQAAKSRGSVHLKDAEQFLRFTAPGAEEDDQVATAAKTQLAADPTYVPALLALGSRAALVGKNAEAIPYYLTALGKFPDLAAAQKALAILYSKSPTTVEKGYQMAIKARKSLPADQALTEALARLSYEKKEYRYALQLLKELAPSQPPNADQLFLAGMCQFHLKQSGEGLKALEQALASGLSEPSATQAKEAMATLKNVPKR